MWWISDSQELGGGEGEEGNGQGNTDERQVTLRWILKQRQAETRNRSFLVVVSLGCCSL